MNNDEKILVVDDDTIFLTYIKRKLSDKFNIFTADSGTHGLELLEKNNPFALVAVDYFMSGMNGVEFLEKVRGKYPDTVQMMLTGLNDFESLMDIINNTNIFRFINNAMFYVKLCEILEKGLEQYRHYTIRKTERKEIDAAYKQLIEYAKALNGQ